MSALLDKFTTNALQTPLGLMVSRASDEVLPNEDWTLIMEICDYVNTHEEGPKDATRALRKRLSITKTTRSTVYALTILETCMKNCGYRFQIHVCQRDYIQDLVKLLQPSRNPSLAIQEKVVALIRNWAEAFGAHPDMKGVILVQQELETKGVIFPPPDLTEVANLRTSTGVGVPAQQQQSRPVTLPQAAHREPVPVRSPVNDAPVTIRQTGLSESQLHKLRKDLDVVMGNSRIFSDMLTQLTPGQEEPAEYQLLKDVNTTCREMQARLVQLVEEVANEDVTCELLRVNDELNNVFVRYDRYERIREIHVKNSQAGAQESTLIPDLSAPIAPVRNKSLPGSELEGFLANPSEPQQASVPFNSSAGLAFPTSDLPSFPPRASNMPQLSSDMSIMTLEPLPAGTGADPGPGAQPQASDPSYDELFTAATQQPQSEAAANNPSSGLSTEEFDSFLESRGIQKDQNAPPESGTGDLMFQR